MGKEQDDFLRETIELIPETGCPRQERILRNSMVRQRIKILGGGDLVTLAFSQPDQHLLSFYELAGRLAESRFSLSELVELMQALREARETRKIRDLYWRSYEELERRLKSAGTQEIIEGMKSCNNILYRRLVSEIEFLLARRSDGIEIGKMIAPLFPNFDIGRLTEMYCQMNQKQA